MSVVFADGHELRLLEPHVVEIKRGSGTQYATIKGGRVLLCDGLGNIQSRQVPAYLSRRVRESAKRLLEK